MSLAEEFLPEPIPLPAYDNLRHVFDRQDVYRYGRKAHRDSEAAVVESEFAALLGRKFALAVNSGGSAILLALLAAGVRPGDDVLLPAFTFTAVTSAVVLAGARPVFVDCRENYCVDPIDLEKKLLGGARFLLLSYMRGHVADLDRIIALCERQGVKLIEDCAHSLGTKWRGRQTGVFGVASCFSFQDKLINAGEGGFVATDDPATRSSSRFCPSPSRSWKASAERSLPLAAARFKCALCVRGDADCRRIGSWPVGLWGQRMKQSDLPTRGIARIYAWMDGNKVQLTKASYYFIVFAYLFGLPLGALLSQASRQLDLPISFDRLEFLVAAVIAHLGVLTVLIIDIYKSVRPSEPWFASHQEALPEVRRELLQAVSHKQCTITWLGVSLQSAWLALEEVLRRIEDGSAKNVTIVLLQLHPSYLGDVPGDTAGLAAITETQFRYMTMRCRSIDARLRSSQSKIVLYQYSYMPNLHGVLINDEILFNSHVRWCGHNYEELSVPREPYERIDMRTERGRYVVDSYKCWVEKGKICAWRDNRVFVFPEDAIPV